MKIQLLLIFTLLLTFTFEAHAVNSVALETENSSLTVTNDQQNVFTKVGNWFKKQKNKVVKFVTKKLMAIDWSDPATVLRYAIIGLIVGLLLSITSVILAFVAPGIIVSIVSWISYLAWLAGVILFWYWVYLKFIA